MTKASLLRCATPSPTISTQHTHHRHALSPRMRRTILPRHYFCASHTPLTLPKSTADTRHPLRQDTRGHGRGRRECGRRRRGRLGGEVCLQSSKRYSGCVVATGRGAASALSSSQQSLAHGSSLLRPKRLGRAAAGTYARDPYRTTLSGHEAVVASSGILDAPSHMRDHAE